MLSRTAMRACATMLLIAQAPFAQATCPPAGWDAARLQGLKEAAFVIDDAAERNALALALVDCLGNPDPAIRDGMAFEAYFTWLRADLLDALTRSALLDGLSATLRDEAAPDQDGFQRPFAALVLAEIARSDRKSPWLSNEQRGRLVDDSVNYLRSVKDYRGFDAAQGWRHGVAHGADLVMQLALNEKLDKAQLDALLGAVATQVTPADEHFYIYGEPERLARPVVFVAMRGLHDAAAWKAWMEAVTAPGEIPWDKAHLSQAGLAKRHNTRNFLLGLQTQVRDSRNEKLAPIQPALEAALTTVR